MHLASFNTSALFLLIVIFAQSDAELITSLPGQPGDVSFNQYFGYIVTDAQHGRALFYYFAEAHSVDPLTCPLTLWFNGGPGCSSLGFGAFMENGPFQPGENGVLVKNKYSWNLESNMLYIESPIGVGFSYSKTDSDYNQWNDSQTAEDNLRFLLNWLEKFPKYKNSDLYLTGESYAGHYIPQLAALIVDHNIMRNSMLIKLKAIALGNPLLDLDISINAGEYLWSHGAISDETLFLERTVCNDSTYRRQLIQRKVSQGCNDVFHRVKREMAYIDNGDLLLPLCLLSSNAEQFRIIGKHAIQYDKVKLVGKRKTGDPCLGDEIFTYLNRPDVQEALHANTSSLPYVWDFCQGGPLVYHEVDLDKNSIPVVAALIEHGIPVTLFSGDQDSKIPLTQTRIITNILAKDLKLVSSTNYGLWFDKKQVGGWTESFSGVKNGKNATYVTYATVRGAAHEVPFTSPSQALTLFRAFLAGSPLP